MNRELLLVRSSIRQCFRCIQTTAPIRWQGFENERHYEPGEDFMKRTWHGLAYDFRRWKRRYQEVRFLKYISPCFEILRLIARHKNITSFISPAVRIIGTSAVIEVVGPEN